MRHVYRPDDAPGWNIVLWFAVGGLALDVIVALFHGSNFSELVSVAIGSVVVWGGLTALIVVISRQSRLIVDGSEVVHRQVGRSQRASGVGTGWRLITYDTGYGQSRTYVRVLFDRDDHARIRLNGAMWSITLLASALGPLGVKIMNDGDMVGPSEIDSMTMEQIGALSDEEAARLMKKTVDPTVPRLPNRVVRHRPKR